VSAIGRRVAGYGCQGGTVDQWEPLGSALCDALVRRDDGSVCWYALHGLRPIDDLGPLPSRADAIEAARAETLASLREIRRQHVAAFHEPWPGCEHGKAIVGRAIDRAIADIEAPTP
jgi:hypothetical protein